MVDPYKAGFFSENPYAAKTAIHGKLVVVLRGKLEKRELELIPMISRAVQKHEVHELIITDELAAGPGSKVNKIAYIGFVEIAKGGVLVVGDTLTVQGKSVGQIVGFDETHLPNHLNIVIASENRVDGIELGVQLESEINFK
ncbi:hypothetical protein [Desulfosporosinus sp. OT]|uniref:DUF6917 domain-containing protein n=1 Tax=Desulfosporosinus sp. OT TaxID=913865 RepID=UPI000223AA0E|nr:hypothetical protein [Desulfosporosinus sp. OT]EGW41215.1 hypothetical protein DOT_0855 [Desulfosporosinus sp. OT]